MINRKHRFHGHKGLRYVYQNGRSTRGTGFAIKSLVNPHRASYRLAVVVSRKVEKSAVKRNRLRRRLYEAVRSFEPEIDGPHDMVLTVFSTGALTGPGVSLNEQVRDQLQAAGVLSNKTANPKK